MAVDAGGSERAWDYSAGSTDCSFPPVWHCAVAARRRTGTRPSVGQLREVGAEGWWWRSRKRRLKVARFLVWDLQVDVKLFNSPRHSPSRSGCAPAIHLLAVAAPAGRRAVKQMRPTSYRRAATPSSSVRTTIALTFFAGTLSSTLQPSAPFHSRFLGISTTPDMALPSITLRLFHAFVKHSVAR